MDIDENAEEDGSPANSRTAVNCIRYSDINN